MISLWRGYHSSELPRIVSDSWEKNQLLVLVPPTAKDFSFLRLFAEVEFLGDWSEVNIKAIRQSNPYDVHLTDPRIGTSAFAIFTSGTQSLTPRLVFYSKENILFSLNGIRGLYDTSRIKKIFCFPQPTHTFGFILGYVHAVLFGLQSLSAVGPYGRKTLQKWFEDVDETTLTLGTPTHFIDLLSYKSLHQLSPGKSYSAIVGGATVTKSLWSQIQNDLNVEQPSVGYGATEASPGITHLPPGVKPQDDGDVGLPIPGVHVESTANGICFSGPNVCLAIFENNSLNFPKKIELKDKLIEINGHFHFAGRSDLIINRGGLKLSLEKIENLVQSKFGLKSLAVDVYDARLGREIYLLIQDDEEKKELNDKASSAVTADRVHQFLMDAEVRIAKENIVQEKIPLNLNFKFDRNKARKLILGKMNLQFPISVKHLEDHLPHRYSAVWMDELLEVQSDYGRGLIRFDNEKTYSSGNQFRPGSCVEFVAQCYGYTVVMQDVLNIKSAPAGKVALIVEVKNVRFSPEMNDLKLKDQEELIAEVWRTSDFGQLKLFKGKVSCRHQEIASLELKVFVP